MKSNVIEMTSAKSPGTLVSGYRATLETIDQLMNLLNKLELAGHLPKERDPLFYPTNNVIQSALQTIRLGKMHFPDMKFGTEKNEKKS